MPQPPPSCCSTHCARRAAICRPPAAACGCLPRQFLCAAAGGAAAAPGCCCYWTLCQCRRCAPMRGRCVTAHWQRVKAATGADASRPVAAAGRHSCCQTHRGGCCWALLLLVRAATRCRPHPSCGSCQWQLVSSWMWGCWTTTCSLPQYAIHAAAVSQTGSDVPLPNILHHVHLAENVTSTGTTLLI
jgi:hypothetical protein